MRFDVSLPRDYPPGIPPFRKDGTISERVDAGLENVLFVYAALARDLAQQTDNNPDNYRVSKVSVVGSGARSNRPDSDLDFLLIVSGIDVGSANTLKMFMSMVFFTDRLKPEAIDIYLRSQDAYPERASVDISDQVREKIDRYNAILTEKR